jgi:hypothetical protein
MSNLNGKSFRSNTENSSNILNGLFYYGKIYVNTGFPLQISTKVRYVWEIMANVTDNDPTKTNTGLSFIIGDIIHWTGKTWEVLGNHDHVKDLTVSLTSINVAALGTEFELLASSGADTSYELIDIKWVINPSVVLDVSGQNLEIYFKDSDKYLGLIRTDSLQKAAKFGRGVQIQAEHEFGIDKAVMCKLSNDVDPASGTATMDFYFIYKVISLT